METTYICLWCNNRYDELPLNGICPHCGYDHFNHCKIDFSETESQAVILKLGNYDTLNSMRNGSIWFQSPKYYQDYKGSPAICDISECAYDFIIDVPLEKVTGSIPIKVGDVISHEGKELILKEFKGAKICIYSNTQNYNRLLCFYMLKMENGKLAPRDDKLRSFGTHFSLVDIKKLSKMIHAYASEHGIFSWSTNVKYTTEAYRGAYNPTCKDGTYAYQNEYRFIMQSDELNQKPEKEPLKIQLDGMEDVITEPQPLEKLFAISDSKDLFELFGIFE